MITLFRDKSYGKSYCTIDPATALLAGSAISAGGSIFGGIFGSSAAKQQAAAIREAAEIASRTALEIDTRQRTDLAPFRQYGVTAGDTLMGMLTGGKDVSAALQESPLYKFQSELGTRDLNRQLSARGLYNSGAGLETLVRFSNQLVAEEGQRFYDRLYNLTALGSNAAARTATNTASIGSGFMQTQGQLGLAGAQAQGAQLGAWANTAQSLGSLGQTVAGYPLYNASLGMLNRMGPQQQSPAQPTTNPVSLGGFINEGWA